MNCVAAIPRRHSARSAGMSACLCVLALAALLGCNANTEPKPPEIAFVARPSSDIRAELAPNSAVVKQLTLGERVEILARRRSTIRVRTDEGVEGWTHESDVVSEAVREQMVKLSAHEADSPPQGVVRAFDVLNVHVEPSREATTVYQLQQDEGADLLRREVAATTPTGGIESWYLVRLATGQVGWLLSSRVYSDIPVEVAQYAEGKPIIAYFALGEISDRDLGKAKTTWLWTQTDSRAADYDFDRFRVFRWSPARGSYQTIKLERHVEGYLPIRVGPVETDGGSENGFVVTVKKDGQRFNRTYALVGQRVKLISEEEVKPPKPVMIETPPQEPQPEGLVDRLLSWLNSARQR